MKRSHEKRDRVLVHSAPAGRVSTRRGALVWSCVTRALVAVWVVLLVGYGTAMANDARIGFHGGLSIPNIKGGTNEVSEGYTSRFGPYFGVFAGFEVRSPFSIRAEINYASQGGKRNGMQPIPAGTEGLPPDIVLYASFDNETILDYIEIPIMAELGWGRAPHVYVDLGPYVGFLVRAKTVTGGTSQLFVDKSGTPFAPPPDYEPLPPYDFTAESDSKQDINSTNAGIAGAVGLEVPVGPGNVVFDAHFSMGLTDIQKDTVLNGENQTGAVALTIGYSHPLRW